MKLETIHPWRQDALVVAVFVIVSAAMCFLPSPPGLSAQAGEREEADVVSVDNSALQLHGFVKFGTQHLQVLIKTGRLAGHQVHAVNEIRAQLELDKEFQVGDRVMVSILPDDDAESIFNVQDYERTWWTYALCGLFCLLLIAFGGWTGIKALFSFVISCQVIWKVVIPLVLDGWMASVVCFGAVCFLTAAIMFLVAGFTRKGYASFAGAIAGVFSALVLAHVFTRLMNINGAVLPYAQTLLFSGYSFLNLQDLFIGAIMLASSGAVMDLGMDIASGVQEVALHNPSLGRADLIRSGMNIGRSVVGTMTTTLLLAYSGGYISLLMMFAAQNNSLRDIINNPLVASECVKTLIGSFGLVLVAPFTAVFSGILFAGRKGIEGKNNG